MSISPVSNADWDVLLAANSALPSPGERLDVKKLAPLLWNKEGEPSRNTLRAWESDIAEFLIWLEGVTTAPESDPSARGAPAKGPGSSLKDQVPLRALATFLDALSGSVSDFPNGLADMLAAYRKYTSGQGNPLRTHSLNRRITTMAKLAVTAIRQGWAREMAPRPSAKIERSWGAATDERTLTPTEVKQLLSAPDKGTVRGKRDRALLLVLIETGFHRRQLRELNADQFSVPARTREGAKPTMRGYLRISREDGCGEAVPLSAACTRALSEYLGTGDAADGTDPPMPLFRSLDRRPEHRDERLTVDGIYALVVEYGKEIGLEVTPRLLRRTAQLNTARDIRKKGNQVI